MQVGLCTESLSNLKLREEKTIFKRGYLRLSIFPFGHYRSADQFANMYVRLVLPLIIGVNFKYLIGV